MGLAKTVHTHRRVLYGSKNLALVSFPGLIWVKHRQWSALTHKPIVSLRTRIKHHLGSPYPNTKHAQRIYKLGISWPDKHQHASSSLGPRAFLTYPPQTALYNNPTGIDIFSLLDFPSRPPLPSPLGIRRSLTVSQCSSALSPRWLSLSPRMGFMTSYSPYGFNHNDLC